MPWSFGHCWINQVPSHLLLLHPFFQLLVSPIHWVVWTGKPGLMPFAVLALIPYIISQLVLPGFLMNMSLIHSFCLFIFSKISLLFSQIQNTIVYFRLNPSHSHQNGPLKMQDRVAIVFDILWWFAFSCIIISNLHGTVYNTFSDLSFAYCYILFFPSSNLEIPHS